MRNQKHGWILFDKENDDDHGRPYTDEDSNFTSNLWEAKVYATRELARVTPNKLKSDTVKKVETDEHGIAIKIIKGR